MLRYLVVAVCINSIKVLVFILFSTVVYRFFLKKDDKNLILFNISLTQFIKNENNINNAKFKCLVVLALTKAKSILTFLVCLVV